MFQKLSLSLGALGLFGFIFVTAVSAQTGSLTGTVIDFATGDPLPGSHVVIRELARGTASDIDGRFEITNIPEGDYTVEITYLGYEPAEERLSVVSGPNTLNVVLQADFLGFDEIVVTGTGAETSKKRLGIDVASVSREKLTRVEANTISGALTGKIAGARITNAGRPGAPASIVLRGINTMGVSRPMILVDGIEVDVSAFESGSDNDLSDRLSDLDLSNVERVEVVKGAAAATLYGAQGANGVIQIFTRGGTAGKMQVNLSSSVSVDRLNESNMVKQSTRYHSYPTDADGNIIGMGFDESNGIWTIPSNESNGVVNKPYTGYIGADGETVPLAIQTDRIPGFYESTISRTHDLTVSGGNEQTRYLVSGNILNQDGIEPETGFDRYSFRVNTDTDILQNLQLSLRTNYIQSDQSGVSESGDNVESGLYTLLTTEPFVDVFRRNEKGQFPAKFTSGSVGTNPFFFKDIQSLSTETNRFIGSTNVNYQPLPILEIDYRLGVDWYYSQFDRIQKNAQGFEDPNTDETEVVLLQPDGFVERQGRTNRRFNSILDAFIRTDFQRDFNVDLPVTSTTLLKFDWRRSDFQRTESMGTNLPFGLDLETLRAASTPSIDEFRSEFVTYGFLVNQKFEYAGLTGLSAGVRADKSSAFGEAAEFSYFPRGDIYLRVSDLDFWDPLAGTVDEFKLRAAYGEAGVQPGPYQRFVTLSQGLIGSQGTFTTSQTAANPSLGVEESKETEIGGELGLAFGGNWFQSVGISATLWSRNNRGTIQSLETAPSIGAGQILDNAIDLSSRGMDISLNSLVYYGPQWNWLANIHFGTAGTTVDRIANGEDLILEPATNFRYLFREGETFGVFYGFKPLTSPGEINAETGEPYIDPSDRDRFVIVDGAVVNRFNKQIQFRSNLEKIGDPTPDFTLSLRNEIRIRQNLELMFQLDWVQGGDIFNGTKWWMFNTGVHEEFEEPVLIDGGETPGGELFDGSGSPTGQISRVDGSRPLAWRNYHASKRMAATPYFVEDGTHLKLRELAITWNVAPLLGFENIRFLRLGVTGRNILTFTGFSGFDPEVSGVNQDVRFRGLDLFTYPNYRTFTFRVSAGI